MAILTQNKLIQRIVEDFQGRIIRREIQAGEKLPSQDKLAESLGISRGSLREALNQLVLMGIIEMRQGSGTYVKSLTPSSYMSSLSSVLSMEKASVSELLDARLCIEGGVAWLAAKKRTEEDIEAIREVVAAMTRDLKAGQIQAFSGWDIEFHFLVAKASKNSVLVKVVETLRGAMYQFMANLHSRIPEILEPSLNSHQKIFEAIEGREPVEARRQMESHINFLIVTNNREERILFET